MKERTNNISRRKLIAVAVAMVMLLCCAVGGTYAFLTDKTDEASNSFTVGTVSCEVDEELEGNAKTAISVKNTGTADSFVRIALLSYMTDENGNPTVGEAVCNPVINDEFWFLGNDGFYYCKSKVAGGESSPSLLADDLVLVDGQVVEVIAENIQADGKTSDGTPAVVDAWGSDIVKINDSGQLEKVSSSGGYK